LTHTVQQHVQSAKRSNCSTAGDDDRRDDDDDDDDDVMGVMSAQPTVNDDDASRHSGTLEEFEPVCSRYKDVCEGRSRFSRMMKNSQQK